MLWALQGQPELGGRWGGEQGLLLRLTRDRQWHLGAWDIFSYPVLPSYAFFLLFRLYHISLSNQK